MERNSSKHGGVDMLSSLHACQASLLNIQVCCILLFGMLNIYKTKLIQYLFNFLHNQGNDMRYKKYLKDVRFSVSETLIRSIESNNFSLHRKLPKSESLKDCMDRTIPYFTEHIMPEAVSKGKRVLIASSENAIRGLLMHLCEIPEEHISGLEIPNGLPLIFDLNSKCLKLLDDGTGRDPLEVHNFGASASYLFRPCTNADGSLDEECAINFMSDNIEISSADSELINSIRRPVASKV